MTKTSNLKVCTGWSQEWMSAKRIQSNGYFNVQEIVRGPFSSPRLLQAQPFIAVAPSEREAINITEKYGSIRRGIPDTWREYLATKGLCGTIEACVLKKNLIPSCVRCLATDKLWNDIGLPLIQGIPDPWKSKSVLQKPSAKCLRRRYSRGKNISTHVSPLYDGDDEADMERNVKRQFNKDRVHAKKDVTQEARCELKFPQREQEVLQIYKNPWKEMKRGDNKKHRKIVDEELKSTVCADRKAIAKKRGKSNGSNKLVHQGEKKLADEKCCLNNVPLQKSTQTCTIKKMNEAVQVNMTAESKAAQIQSSFLKKDVDANAQSIFNIICSNCLLRNYMIPSIQRCSNFANPLHGIHLSNPILCKECENLYYKNKPQERNSRSKMLEYCTTNTKRLSAQKKITRYMRSKLCDCMQMAKERFGVQRCSSETRNAFRPKEEMKLACYCCNSPYLKISSINRNGIVRKRSVCSCKIPSNRLKKKRIHTKDRVIKCSVARKRSNIVRRSKKSGCTCVENKRHVSKCDPERSSHSINVQWKNGLLEKSEKTLNGNGDVLLKKRIHKSRTRVELRRNSPSGSRTTISDEVQNEEVFALKRNNGQYRQLQFIDCKGLGVSCKKEETEDGCCSNLDGNEEAENKSDYTTITSYAKFDVAELSSSKSEKSKWCSVSDSGNYGDESDSMLNGVAHDKLSVTSVTFMRRLNDAIPKRKSNSIEELRKPCRLSTENSRKQIRKIEDQEAYKNRNNYPNGTHDDACCIRGKKEKDSAMVKKLIDKSHATTNKEILKYRKRDVEKYEH